MKNDHMFDDPSMGSFEDIDIEVDMEPNMEYVFTSLTSDRFVCNLTLNTFHRDLVLAPFKKDINHSVLQISPYQVKRCPQSKEITLVDGDVKDRICIIDFGDQNDINAICGHAIKRHAKAFIVKSPPNVNVPVPVFIVSTTDLQKMTISPDALVNIQQRINHGSEEIVRNDGVSDVKVEDGSESTPIDLVNTTESHPLLEENDGGSEVNHQLEPSVKRQRLSVPRYTVSLFALDYTKHMISQTWDLDASCSYSPVLVPGIKHKVVCIPEGSRKLKDESYIEGSVEGWVCACNSSDAEIVTKVRDDAIHCRAVALFSITAPVTKSNFPVFVGGGTFLETIFLHAETAQVMFELHDVQVPLLKAEAQRNENLSVHPLVHDAAASSRIAASLTESANEIQTKAQDKSNINDSVENDTDNVAPTYAAVVRSKKQEKKERVGIIASVYNFFAPRGPIFKENNDFIACYVQAFNKVESMKLKDALDDGKEFIKEKKHVICLGHFAALAHLCSKSNDVDLIHELAQCLRHYNPSDQDGRLLTMNPRNNDVVKPQQVLYDFLGGNVNHWAERNEVKDNYVHTIMWKGMVLLSKSGLIRKQIDISDIERLRGAINPSIFVAHKEDFVRSLGEDATIALTLCFQASFVDFIQVLRIQKQPGPVSLNKIKLPILLKLVGEQLQADVACAGSMWHHLSDVSGKVISGKKDAKTLLNKFTCAIGCNSLQAINALSELVTAVDESGICDFGDIVTMLETKLVTSLFVNSNFSIEEVSHFYSLRLSKFIYHTSNCSTLKKYAAKAMTSEGACRQKLELVDLTYKKISKDMNSPMVGEAEMLLIECLKTLLSHKNTTFPILCDILKTALSKPELSFFHSAEDDTMKTIASDVMLRCVAEIKSQPMVLREIPDVTAETPRLVNMIVGSIRSGLQHSYNSVVEATVFFDAVVDKPRSSHLSLAEDIAEAVFRSVLMKWEPKSIVDITQEHKLTIDVIFSESIQGNFVKDKHHKLIQDLVQTWIALYQVGDVTPYQILRVHDTVEAKTWKKFEASTKCILPVPAALLLTIEKIYEIESAVRTMLFVTVKKERVPLSLILDEYCCVPPNKLRYMLEAFSQDQAILSMSKTLVAFKKDHKYLSAMMKQYQETFHICAYFLLHKSILFRDAVLLRTGKSHTIESLAGCVNDACKRIQGIIGPNMHYHGVGDAVKVLSTEDAINSEIAVLKGSKKLKITQTDVTNFEIAAFLWYLSVPLQQFVQCCENFEFAIAAEDRMFAELRIEVQKFYVADCNPIHACLYFVDRLACLLCSESTHATYDKIKDLKTVVPWLSLLSDMSLHPELWNYVAEMEWFGDNGLKRFYEEYSNVTNVLLGQTQSYEMSLLVSLEPAVRTISIVGKYKYSGTMFELFESFKKNRDISAAVQEAKTIEHHFQQVHARLSEIKDWFNGVNEVAASSLLFTRAMNHGKFTVVIENAKYSLAIAIIEGKQSKVEILSGNALDHFILQLSLIQNESKETSSSMEGFIEQFQVLKAAFRNFIVMDMVGFSSISTADFVCRTGFEYMDDAKILYRGTEEHLQTFKIWLSSTRWQYKVSMLFWTEELRDLNKILTSTSEDRNEMVIDFMSRLFPIWTKQRNRSFHQCVLDNIDRFRKNVALSWLEKVSHFIDNCHDNFTSRSENRSGMNKSEFFLHSICCADEEERQCVFVVLTHIYKERLPYVFEVLDGSVPCNEDRLCLFLDRVKAFPSLKFTIINADKLDSTNLEALLLFLSDQQVISMGIRLHCVQRGDSLIHTSPWIEGKSWSPESLLSFSSRWKSEIGKFTSVMVVASKNCSTGKTHFIRKKMNKKKTSGHSATLTIHEMSSISSLVQALKLKFPGSRQNCTLHISFLYLPIEVNNARWLSEMNHFFFSLIVLRYIYDPSSGCSFSLTGKLSLFIEMPACTESAQVWLKKNIPIVASCAEFPNIRIPFDIDAKARRVCTYLRAYDNGTIDRKYEGSVNKRIVLVLDTSGSMEGDKFTTAKKNALSIFDSHIVEGDEFGVILFDHEIYYAIPIQVVGPNIATIRQSLLHLFFYGGGTSMYNALAYTFRLLHQTITMDSWVVCLTDGVSDGKNYNEFTELLMQSQENHHLVTVGIALPAEYEQAVLAMCQKYTVRNASTKGFFVRADATTRGMDDAFNVVKSKIPVSKTFDRDGAMSDTECRQYMAKYLPDFIDDDDMIAKSFWIRFLYRRVFVFDNNESFNYNETYENLGSSLMKIMLLEVERLLSHNQQRDWQGENYIQLIYDFTFPEKPEFRLVCTAPHDIDPDLKKKLTSLDLPGFHIPTKQELDNRSSLDLFLSAALGVPLQESDDGLLKIRCIDDHGFVLTIDFTMKLLSIHERVACQVPCVIEGETGVSKTALTKMYAILRNHSLTTKAQQKTSDDLSEIEHRVKVEGFTLPNASTSFERLDSAMALDVELAKRILVLVQEKAAKRPSIFIDLPPLDGISDGRQYLEFFRDSELEKTFFEINVDASLTEGDFIKFFEEVTTVATKISDSEATVVVFLDEINTSTVLGLLKEIIIDRSISGKMLMENIIIVGACNPPRAQIQSSSTREQDLGKTWASGHYQVSELPPSLKKMKWSFGALSHSQEKEFIYRRMEMMHGKSKRLKSFLRASLTEMVSTSHEMIRKFAKDNISDAFGRCRNDSKVDNEAVERARSVVSLRDIQRVFALYAFFVRDMPDVLRGSDSDQSAILLSIAIVYYLRLDKISREKFAEAIDAVTIRFAENLRLLDILNKGMDTIVAATDIPVGIAMTRGLKENIFATLVCSLSQTPLIIVGPPGASKTLAVHIVGDNASGSDSCSTFYSSRPRLSLFHYQCSKTSTSKEIAAVFDQAFQRQENVDSTKNRCVVFMDEAGLPEEEKESLKVLHYLLEGHMSAKSKVGFVAISNHILDAAKSNRCAMLLRQDPDEEEMLSIAVGVLFDFRQDGHYCAHDVQLDEKLLSAQQFATSLCSSYTYLFDEDSPVFHLNTFYGLRDFVYLLKAIRSLSRVESTRFITTIKTIVYAIERNFNGVLDQELYEVTACFVKPLMALFSMQSDVLDFGFRDPLSVLKEALQPVDWKNYSIRPRFKLVIDCTEDDSILRLLSKSGIVEMNRKSLHKLSSLPDDVEFERIRLVSGVKFAAMQGNFAVLSQTEPVNESFYDLFNQRFHELTKQDGSVTMFANIAVGGVSRRSLVLPTFECIVHVRESNLLEIPAPFLNRFEKYRLTLNDVFVTTWSKFNIFSKIVVAAKRRVEQIIATFGSGIDRLCWVVDSHTLESIFIDMLPGQGNITWSDSSGFGEGCLSIGFKELVTLLLEKFTSLRGFEHHMDPCIQLALIVFPVDIVSTLNILLHEGCNAAAVFQFFSTNESTSKFDDNAPLNAICGIMQMILTRIAIFRIAQLCTPEAIFINRETIPSDLIQEYFNQQHFSLKELLSNSSSGNNFKIPLLIVHTRSDHFIHAIPCLPADRVTESTTANDTVRKLIHDNPDKVIVEHVNRLRSESAVRTSIQEWLIHQARDIYIIFVDMSHKGAVDQVNYIRMQVEQHIFEKELLQKFFYMVLHYPPSSSMKTNCYPSLFLGGWEHIFLDSVGDSSAVDVGFYISHACISNNLGVKVREKCVEVLLQTILPRVLPHLVSQNLFYRDQSLFKNGSFTDRKMVLTRLLAARIDSSTFQRIICEKFAEMWCDHILVRVIRRSSLSLVSGTTQLSLTMSIHNAMVHIFQSYMIDILVQGNQWKNCDLVSCSLSSTPARNSRCLKLFEIVLREIPSLPIDELMLQRQRLSINRLIPLPSSLPKSSEARFPFFQLISSFLDEFVENVFKSIANQKCLSTPSLLTISASEVLQKAMVDIHDENNECLESPDRYDRRKLVFLVVDYVRRPSIVSLESSESPFEVYLHQYIEWKLGCTSNSVLQHWWTIHLRDLNDIAVSNIIAVHVIARIYRMDIIKIASAVELLESLSESWDLSQKAEVVDDSELCNILFQSIEQHLACMRDPSRPATLQWPLLLSSAFYKTNTTTIETEAKELTERIRRIGLVSLNEFRLPSTDDENITESNCHFQADAEKLDSNSVPSTTAQSRSEEIPTISLLERFLSPIWVLTTQFFLSADVELLLNEIENGVLCGSKAVGLLKSASYDSKAVGLLKSASYETAGGLQFHGYSLKVLLQVTERLNPGYTAQFTEIGDRRCLPHYIPHWLQANGERTRVETYRSALTTIYFAEYHNAITGKVADVIFEFFLSVYVTEAATMTSSQLFLILWKEIDAEAKLTRQMHTQVSRLRRMGTATSLHGSQTAMIAIDARIVCFVAKVASEVADDMKASVLEEAYASEAIEFLDELLGRSDVAKWQEFFIATILRLRGEGTLCLALKGPLTCFSWCKKWAEGIPDCGSDLMDKLRHAEGALNSAREDEHWKTQNERSCPHCRQAFTVSALNCGRFICGRDYHGNNGRAVVDGVDTGITHGCGREFQLHQAISHQMDETKIAAQQAIVDEISEKLNNFEQCSSLWSQAGSMLIPPVAVVAEKCVRETSFYPTVKLLEQKGLNPKQEKCVQCIRVLWEYSSFSRLVQLLPDLIELYVWLHETLRFLVTRDFAYEKSISDLMRKEVLQERFDTARVHHLLELWERVSVGFDTFLTTNKRMVTFECEDVRIPFDKLQNAKLICLLSDGSQPTENDFLFLVINYIVSMYNNFTEKMSSFCMISNDIIQNKSLLSPRYIVRGFGGAIRISSLAPLPVHCLDWLAACSWDANSEKFDLTKAEILLNDIVNLCHAPSWIMNPLDHLREKFCFRNDVVRSFGQRDADKIINVDRRGNFHGNFHDFELFEAAYELLTLLDMVQGDVCIRRTIMDLFQSLDYERIRTLLEGCRTILDELFKYGNKTPFASLDAFILEIDSSKKLASSISRIEEFGFPEMNTKQVQLILSLKPHQFVELIWYCGYQLASEAHLFANLPLYVSDPLTDQMKIDLELNLQKRSIDLLPRQIATNVNEFICDILGFYEFQIVEEASKSVESLQTYLLSQNFCNSDDPTFAALPSSISLRHYISLRQILQQIKLSYMSLAHECQETTPPLVGTKNLSMSTKSVAYCWLWEDRKYLDSSENDCTIVQDGSPRDDKKFWFERDVDCKEQNGDERIEVENIYKESDVSLPMEYNDNLNVEGKEESVASEDVTSDSCEEGSLKQTPAASVLQRWWRTKYEQLKGSDVAMYDCLSDDDDDDDDDIDDDDDDDDIDIDDDDEGGKNENDSVLEFSNGVARCHLESKSTVDSRVAVDTPEASSEVYATYGTNNDKIKMRVWLDQQRLPQSVGDALVIFGVRTIEDVCYLLAEDEEDEIKELLSGFAPLDRHKLRKAVKLLSSTPSSIATDSETFDSNSNWLDEME